MIALDPTINNWVIAILGGVARLIVVAPIFIYLEKGGQVKSWILPAFTIAGLIVVIALSFLMSPLHFTWQWFLGGAVVIDLVAGILTPFSGSLIFWIVISPFFAIYYGVKWYLRLKRRIKNSQD